MFPSQRRRLQNKRRYIVCVVLVHITITNCSSALGWVVPALVIDYLGTPRDTQVPIGTGHRNICPCPRRIHLLYSAIAAAG